MKTAEVINQGSVQSVRLPQGLRIEGTEVFVKRVGQSLVLIPKDSDPWQMLLVSLDQFTEDYMQNRAQPSEQQRKVAFE